MLLLVACGTLGSALAAEAQTSPSPFTTGYRYDSGGRLVGKIGPDPDDAGPRTYPALRNTYDSLGNLTKTEIGSISNWQSEATAPSSWPGFSVLHVVEISYDVQGRPIRRLQYGATSTIALASQTAYDATGRVTCNAVRMNQPTFASLPASACTLGTSSAHGPDRITYTSYDNLDRVTQITSGFGTAAVRIEKTVTYSANGLQATVADGKGNKTTYERDGFDRLVKVRYPSPTAAGTSSTTDVDQFSYDAAGNVIQQIKRGGQTYNFAYDALNRATNGIRGETFTYDNLSRPTAVSLGGLTNTLTYDALGRVTRESMFGWNTDYQYDKAGNRTRITWPDGFYATYDYDRANAVTAIKENGSAPLATYGYDNLGLRTSLARADGVNTTYTYNARSLLNVLTHAFPQTANNVQVTLNWHQGNQVFKRATNNTAYDWAGLQQSRSYGVNGLNQMTSAGSQTLSYNARGNLSSDGSTLYYYDVANNLTGTSTNYTQNLDPTGRVWLQTASGVSTVMIYSGQTLIAEHNDTGGILRRYVPGPGVDEPLAWYEYGGTTSRRFLIQDQQGSVIAVTNGSGGALAKNTYDEYGVPAAGNLGRYQYTGQTWIPQIGLYHYKARAYSPTLGRFLQTDPIGYDDGLNWYAYVGNDPLNRSDPTGLSWRVGLRLDFYQVVVRTGPININRTVIVPVPIIYTNDPYKTPGGVPVRDHGAKGTGDEYIGGKGWTPEQVDDVLNNPDRTGSVIDRGSKNGKPRNEPATSYVDKDGNYVVQNDKTKEVIQVGTRGESRDKPPQDRPPKKKVEKNGN